MEPLGKTSHPVIGSTTGFLGPEFSISFCSIFPAMSGLMVLCRNVGDRTHSWPLLGTNPKPLGLRKSKATLECRTPRIGPPFLKLQPANDYVWTNPQFTCKFLYIIIGLKRTQAIFKTARDQ